MQLLMLMCTCTLVTLILLYGVETSGSILNNQNKWKNLEEPFVLRISYMIKSKASMLHDIIWSKTGSAPISIGPLF